MEFHPSVLVHPVTTSAAFTVGKLLIISISGAENGIL